MGFVGVLRCAQDDSKDLKEAKGKDEVSGIFFCAVRGFWAKRSAFAMVFLCFFVVICGCFVVACWRSSWWRRVIR